MGKAEKSETEMKKIKEKCFQTAKTKDENLSKACFRIQKKR